MQKTTKLPSETESALEITLFCENPELPIASINQKLLQGLFPGGHRTRTVVGGNHGKTEDVHHYFSCPYQGNFYEAIVGVPTSHEKPVTLKILPSSTETLPEGLVTAVQNVFAEYQEIRKVA